jgi:hypothetical protein
VRPDHNQQSENLERNWTLEEVEHYADDKIGDMFLEATEGFPPQHQEAAKDWLAERSAAYTLVHELQTKGLAALLEPSDEAKPRYINQYLHRFEHGTCHLLPETEDYESSAWVQWPLTIPANGNGGVGKSTRKVAWCGTRRVAASGLDRGSIPMALSTVVLMATVQRGAGYGLLNWPSSKPISTEMSRRPAIITQSDVARAIRAARQSGAAGVEIRPDGAIRILLVAPPLAPEHPMVNEWDSVT